MWTHPQSVTTAGYLAPAASTRVCAAADLRDRNGDGASDVVPRCLCRCHTGGGVRLVLMPSYLFVVQDDRAVSATGAVRRGGGFDLDAYRAKLSKPTTPAITHPAVAAIFDPERDEKLQVRTCVCVGACACHSAGVTLVPEAAWSVVPFHRQLSVEVQRPLLRCPRSGPVHRARRPCHVLSRKCKGAKAVTKQSRHP